MINVNFKDGIALKAVPFFLCRRGPKDFKNCIQPHSPAMEEI